MNKSSTIRIYLLLGLLIYQQGVSAPKPVISRSILVAKDGTGAFKSIQAAINSVPLRSTERVTIYIKNGVYDEKLYIERGGIMFVGQKRDSVIITQSIARDQWRCAHNDDWGVATVNVDGTDITLKNLTIINSFGFEWQQDYIIPCNNDTVNRQKIIGRSSHQMALRTMNATRFAAINCHFKAYGGDTVSPWNVESGMFYFMDCIMEGGVDFYCPRGWAYAENCEFIVHSGTAAIWHDGSQHEDSKTVLKNCRFKGFDGFKLGRYHRDAQFYLVNCSFPSNMADQDIYRVPTNNTIRWGHRVYYFNCHRKGGDYAWHADNLMSAPGAPSPKEIDERWVFKGKWDPVFLVLPHHPDNFK